MKRNPVQIIRYFKDGQAVYHVWDIIRQVTVGVFHDLKVAKECYPRHLTMFGE